MMQVRKPLMPSDLSDDQRLPGNDLPGIEALATCPYFRLRGGEMGRANVHFAGWLVCMSLAPWVSAEAQDSRITVRVYNFANISGGELKDAARVTAGIVGRAGIQSDWVIVAENTKPVREVDYRATRGGECEGTLASAEVVVRLLATAPPGARSMLGVALPCARYGAQITIFADRVYRQAGYASVSYSTALGHILAHELGHVLLRSNQHAHAGIMRAYWGPADWHRVAVSALWFTAEEAAAMQREVRRAHAST